ncbi:MAG TPA: ArsC family reductase [Gammaproteobacteria bacterium]|nr:ArsC family reductase [Gammaproteobacteria bacterium]
MITLYGIPNCDTIRKARRWLDERGVDYRFHDFRKDGLERDQLQAWVDELGWETLLNKRGLMWRRLPEEKKADLDEKRAVALLLEEPAMIKRPVLDLGDRRVVGFSPEDYAALFA